MGESWKHGMSGMLQPCASSLASKPSLLNNRAGIAVRFRHIMTADMRQLIGGLFLGSIFAAAWAQQPEAARAPTAPPPINWPSPPLTDGPIVLDTGIQHQIRLIVTKGLNQPWSMAFLPDGAILVTERPGRLRIVRDGKLDPNPVAGIPMVRAQESRRSDGSRAASEIQRQ